MEMSYKGRLELGVEWRTMNDPTSNRFNVIGGTNFGGISSCLARTNPLCRTLRALPGGRGRHHQLRGHYFPNIGALVHALQTKGDVNVLSTPHLLTTDNEEAEIIVSDNIPFQTSEKFDTNGNPSSPSNTRTWASRFA